jgi:hypothetical protein
LVLKEGPLFDERKGLSFSAAPVRPTPASNSQQLEPALCNAEHTSGQSSKTAKQTYTEKNGVYKIVLANTCSREQQIKIQMDREIYTNALKCMHYFWVVLVVFSLTVLPQKTGTYSTSSHSIYRVCPPHPPGLHRSDFIRRKVRVM